MTKIDSQLLEYVLQQMTAEVCYAGVSLRNPPQVTQALIAGSNRATFQVDGASRFADRTAAMAIGSREGLG